jgi:hypothetical protein
VIGCQFTDRKTAYPPYPPRAHEGAVAVLTKGGGSFKSGQAFDRLDETRRHCKSITQSLGAIYVEDAHNRTSVYLRNHHLRTCALHPNYPNLKHLLTRRAQCGGAGGGVGRVNHDDHANTVVEGAVHFNVVNRSRLL